MNLNSTVKKLIEHLSSLKEGLNQAGTENQQRPHDERDNTLMFHIANETGKINTALFVIKQAIEEQ